MEKKVLKSKIRYLFVMKVIITESQLRRIVKENISNLNQQDEGWRDIFGEPDIKDAARSAYKSQGHSMMGKDDEQRSGEYYMVFNGEKFFPNQIEYADYQDMGDLPRVEGGMLIVPNPAWQS